MDTCKGLAGRAKNFCFVRTFLIFLKKLTQIFEYLNKSAKIRKRNRVEIGRITLNNLGERIAEVFVFFFFFDEGNRGTVLPRFWKLVAGRLFGI